jgi:outer membrane protein assembly complex protein YaeT
VLPASGASAVGPKDIATQLKTVERVRLVGRQHVSGKELNSVLKIKNPSIWPWRNEPILRLDFVKADTVALQQVYRQNGFLDAVVTARIDPGHSKEKVIVTYVITEGPRYKIDRVDLVGFHVVSESSMRRKLFARPGRPFNPLYLLADTSRIAQEHREKGYLPQTAAAAVPHGTVVDVTYGVEPGPQYRFGQVLLSSPGALHIKPRQILKEVLFEPGDIYKASLVGESIEHIYRTGLFSQVQMTPLPDSSNRTIEFDLRLRERPPRWVDVGVGSGTFERLRATAEWGHRNINGRGLQTVVASQLAFDGNARFLLGRLEATLYDPWLLRARRRALMTPYVEGRRDYTNAEAPTDPGQRRTLLQRAIGITFQVRREFGRNMQLSVTQDNSWVDQKFDFSSAVGSGDRDSLTALLAEHYSTHRLQLAINRDTRDDALNPYRGSFSSVSGEIVGGPLSGASSFTRVQGLVAVYRTVRRTSVLAAQIRAGSIDPFGKTTPESFIPGSGDPEVNRVPLEDRFRIGGVNSVRGYAESSLPIQLDSLGVEVVGNGGLAMLQLNLELRIPLAGPFSAEVFTDAGNVWARPSYMKLEDFRLRLSGKPYDADDVRYVAGAGLRLNLPFGPLRFDVSWSSQPDVGRKLHPEYQFAIGPAF